MLPINWIHIDWRSLSNAHFEKKMMMMTMMLMKKGEEEDKKRQEKNSVLCVRARG